MSLSAYIERIEAELLPALQIESVHPHDPVVVHQIPAPWEFVGRGNYTVVVAHSAYPGWVVKVYAPGRPGLTEEADVYRRLGEHPAFSACYARERGLCPSDVHAKNVMLHQGRGYVVDISDFGRNRKDRKWKDLQWAYYKLYLPFLSRRPVRVPIFLLELIRKGYRPLRRIFWTD